MRYSSDDDDGWVKIAQFIVSPVRDFENMGVSTPVFSLFWCAAIAQIFINTIWLYNDEYNDYRIPQSGDDDDDWLPYGCKKDKREKNRNRQQEMMTMTLREPYGCK